MPAVHSPTTLSMSVVVPHSTRTQLPLLTVFTLCVYFIHLQNCPHHPRQYHAYHPSVCCHIPAVTTVEVSNTGGTIRCVGAYLVLGRGLIRGNWGNNCSFVIKWITTAASIMHILQRRNQCVPRSFTLFVVLNLQ